MNWIEKNKKELTKRQVEIDSTIANELYAQIGKDITFALEKELVCDKLGFKDMKAPRPQTLNKWLHNEIDITDYDFKIGESSKGYYIFRKVAIAKD